MAAAETPEEAVAAPLMAFKHSGKPKRLSEAAREAKRRRDQQRDKSRVTLHKLYPRWRNLRDRLGFTMDTELAELLMDSYEKTEASTPQKPEALTSSPPTGLPSDQCPYCGFVLPQWCLQNRNIPKEVPQPQSVEVTLEVKPKEEPVSGSEEEDVKRFVLDGENEGSRADEQNEGGVNSEQDSKPPRTTTDNNHLTETATAAKEEREGSGVDDWSHPWTNNTRPTETAVAEDDEDQEESEELEADDQNSDVDWTPSQLNPKTNHKPTPKRTTGGESGESKHRPGKRKLCTECGMFYRKKPHECEHKTKPFVCNICGKRCVSESYLKLHYGIHLETYEHACKYCHANFRTRADKLAHETVHQEQRDPYKCPDCAMTFPTFKERSEHIKQHRDENPFKCATCGTVFGDRPAFLRHVVVHTGEKAYKCSVCARGFNQASHLKSHMRLHTGERPYSCKHCNKSFNHNVSLKSHVQRCHAAQQEDVSSDAQDTGADGEPERNEKKEGRVEKRKCRRPLTGRPRGRPKRGKAERGNHSIAMHDSGEANMISQCHSVRNSDFF